MNKNLYSKYCQYKGACVNKNPFLIKCKKDGSIRRIGYSCGPDCPHYKENWIAKMKRWWRGC